MQSPPSMFDPNYNKLFPIWQAQQNAKIANQHAHDNYVLSQSNWIDRNVSARGKGLPYGAAAGDPPPVPPQMQVVDDEGNVTYQPFPDLTPTAMPPIGPQTPAESLHGLTGQAGAQAPPPDPIERLTNMLIAIKQQLDTIQAQLSLIPTPPTRG